MDCRHLEACDFSHETKGINGHDEKARIWRKRDEGLRPYLVKKKKEQNKFDVMIWVVSVGRARELWLQWNRYEEILEENCLSWSAQYLDLNIIENKWLYITRKLQSRSGAVKLKAELIEEIRRLEPESRLLTLRACMARYKSKFSK